MGAPAFSTDDYVQQRGFPDPGCSDDLERLPPGTATFPQGEPTICAHQLTVRLARPLAADRLLRCPFTHTEAPTFRSPRVGRRGRLSRRARALRHLALCVPRRLPKPPPCPVEGRASGLSRPQQADRRRTPQLVAAPPRQRLDTSAASRGTGRRAAGAARD